MVVKLTTPECIEFVRNSPCHNTETIERVMCAKLQIEPRNYACEKRGNSKVSNLDTAIPVKITDKRIEKYIKRRKDKNGISHRFTVEGAIMEYKKKHGGVIVL